MPTMHREIVVYPLVVLSFVILVGAGCSSGPEETSSSRKTQDVRGDSDRFFQKMEQEEKK